MRSVTRPRGTRTRKSWKRLYPDTATGGTYLEAILKCTPTRQQSYNPHTGIRIGEASHPGPIDLPSSKPRPVGTCRNGRCQKQLTTKDDRGHCPVCAWDPLCRQCVNDAKESGQCECIDTDPQSAMDSTHGIVCANDTGVPCPVPGCREKVIGFGYHLEHACVHCLKDPVCFRCFKDPPPKWCRCDQQKYMERRNQMDYGTHTPGLPPNPPPQDGLSPVLRFMLATAPTTPPSSVQGPAETGGGGARSSGDNSPPGSTMVTAADVWSQPRPLVWPQPRVSTVRQISIVQYVKNVKHGWRPRAILKHTRTARRWAIANWCKERKFPRCLGRLCKVYIPNCRHRCLCPICSRGPVCLKCRRASIIDDMCTCPLPYPK